MTEDRPPPSDCPQSQKVMPSSSSMLSIRARDSTRTPLPRMRGPAGLEGLLNDNARPPPPGRRPDGPGQSGGAQGAAVGQEIVDEQDPFPGCRNSLETKMG